MVKTKIAVLVSGGGTNLQALIDAQKNPDEYRDLLVRVAGYSAYFVELSKALQDDIIGRTSLSFD